MATGLIDPKEREVFRMFALVVESLVDKPEDVEVLVSEGPASLVFQVRVDPCATGKVIGKNGRVARALRVILGANAARIGRSLELNIVVSGQETQSRVKAYPEA